MMKNIILSDVWREKTVFALCIVMITFYKLGITTIDDREGGSIYNIHYETLFKNLKNIILSAFEGGSVFGGGVKLGGRGVLAGGPPMDDLCIYIEEGGYH